MTEVTVSAPRTLAGPGWPGIAASIAIDGRTFDIYYRASQGPFTRRADPFVPIALLPAMRAGVPLRVRGAVSRQLLRNLSQVQDILCTWYPRTYQKVRVDADPTAPEPARPAGAGAFFSGGVDSFYTALKHQDELSHLIFIHGLDITLNDVAMRRKVSTALRQACTELGKPLLEVETNMRTILDAYTSWNKDSHGAALASVGLALAPQLRKVYINSTATYDRLAAHGSHPLLDPLWSTETLEIIHEGADMLRWRKLESMLDNQTVRRYLRSCWRHPDGAYNCCHCSMCLMNMSFLRLRRVLEQFTAYPQPLDLNEVVRLSKNRPAPNVAEIILLREIERVGSDPELAVAWRAELSVDPGADAWVGQAPQEQAYIQHLSLQLSQARDHEARLRTMDARIAEIETQLLKIETSRSWRMTAPLRLAERIVRPPKEAQA